MVLRVGGEEVQTWQEMRWLLLQGAADHDQIDLELLNRRQEIVVRRLDLTVVRQSGWEGDALDKLGLSLYRPRLPPIIGSVSARSAAEAAGLQSGDEILAIDGEPIDAWADLVRVVRRSPGQALQMEVLRQGLRQRLTV
jgi:regulator of sigma E protease